MKEKNTVLMGFSGTLFIFFHIAEAAFDRDKVKSLEFLNFNSTVRLTKICTHLI